MANGGGSLWGWRMDRAYVPIAPTVHELTTLAANLHSAPSGHRGRVRNPEGRWQTAAATRNANWRCCEGSKSRTLPLGSARDQCSA
jgi:hypothetical protein